MSCPPMPSLPWRLTGKRWTPTWPLPLAIAVALLWAGVAWSFPSPLHATSGGDENDGAPTVRIADKDSLTLEIEGFQARVHKQLNAHVATSVSTATVNQRAAEDAAGALDRPPPQRVDGLAAEIALLQRAANTADAAVAAVKDGPSGLPWSPTFDQLIAAAMRVREARADVSMKQVAAEESQRLAAWWETVPYGTDLPEPMRDQNIRIARAQVELSRATVFLARARLQSSLRDAALLRDRFVPTPAQLESAQAAYAEASAARQQAERRWQEEQAQVQSAHASTEITGTPDERQARILKARMAYDRVDHLRQAAQARARLAEVHQAALAFLLRPSADALPPTLARVPLAAQAAFSEQQREQSENALGELQSRCQALATTDPGAHMIITAASQILSESLGILTTASQDDTRALLAAELTAALTTHDVAPLSPARAWCLTIVAVLAAMALWLGGHHLLRRGADALTRKLGSPPLAKARIMLSIAGLWFVSWAMGATTLVARFIWSVRLGPHDLLHLLSYPVFFIDEKGISAMSLVKFVVAMVAAQFVNRALHHFLSSRIYPALGTDVGVAGALNTLLTYAIYVIAMLIGLQFVGVGLSSLALFAGVVGIGIGFGLRNIAENFISGLIILLERPLQVGDWIDIDGNVEGQVKMLRARSTTLCTRDNISVIIPNSTFVGNRITNWSYGDPNVRIKIAVGVAYGSNVQRVRRILLDVARRHGKVLDRPAPEVQFTDFGSSSLDFLLLCWIHDQEGRFRIASDLRFAIDAMFRRANVTIPFPQRDLHIKSVATEVNALKETPPSA